jgi:hypothetical protein
VGSDQGFRRFFITQGLDEIANQHPADVAQGDLFAQKECISGGTDSNVTVASPGRPFWVVAHDQAASRHGDASSFNLLQLHPKNLKDVGLRSRSRPNRIQNRHSRSNILVSPAVAHRGTLGQPFIRQAQVAQWQSTSLVRRRSTVQSRPWAPHPSPRLAMCSMTAWRSGGRADPKFRALSCTARSRRVSRSARPALRFACTSMIRAETRGVAGTGVGSARGRLTAYQPTPLPHPARSEMSSLRGTGRDSAT